MLSLKAFAEDTIRQSKTGKLNAGTSYLTADPAINVFIVLNDQQAELLRLKSETSAHVWVREQKGTLELVALDNEFDPLQLQIVAMEGKITINTKVAGDLDKAFQELQIEPPLSALEERIREIHAQIERLTQELNGKRVPYRNAAQMAHVDMDNIPEVVELRQNSAESVAVLEGDAQALDAKLARIGAILQGLAR